MFMKQRGPFGRPTVTNIQSLKNKNVYIQPQTVSALNESAKRKIHEAIEQQQVVQSKANLTSSSSTIFNRFYVSLQQPASQTDNTIAWVSPVLPPLINQKARNLYIKQQNYMIVNYYGEDFPRIIWIVCPGLNGYLGNDGVATGRVAALVLTQVMANIDDSGTKVLDLLYSLQDEVTWALPNNLQVQFKVQLDDNTFVEFPSTNSIQLNFQIRQIGI